MAALFLFALHLAQARETLAADLQEHYVRELLELPAKVKVLLGCASQCEQIAAEFQKVDDFLFMGRAIHYPIAMDGALKLKEVSYVHAEGYPTGETKHGPNALIDETFRSSSLRPATPTIPARSYVMKRLSAILPALNGNPAESSRWFQKVMPRSRRSQTMPFSFRMLRNCCPQFWRLFRCNSSRITWQ